MSEELRRDVEELVERLGKDVTPPRVEMIRSGGRRIKRRKQLMSALAAVLSVALGWLVVGALVLPSEDLGPLEGNRGFGASSTARETITFVGPSEEEPEVIALFTMDSDGSDVTRVSGSSASEFYPVWSADGKKLAFVRAAEDGNTDIYTMNGDGSGIEQLTSDPSIDTDPSWSPDGSRIAFTRNLDGQDEIYVVDADGSNEVRLTINKSVEGNPAWSPDGEWIAFARNDSGNVDIYAMRADGSSTVRLTDDPAMETEPLWTPDGSGIVFLQEMLSSGNEFFMMSSDGKQTEQLSADGLYKNHPTLSADGSRLVFSAGATRGADDSQIYSMTMDGTGLTRITDLQRGAQMPAVHP